MRLLKDHSPAMIKFWKQKTLSLGSKLHKLSSGHGSQAEIKGGDNLHPLSLGEHVVWISDRGPERGVVRWLGMLPECGSDLMVGVEFENPVGSGTGLHNNKVLFEAKPNHASLIPVIGLMKEKDFRPPTSSSSGFSWMKSKKKKDKDKEHHSSKTPVSSVFYAAPVEKQSACLPEMQQATHPKMLDNLKYGTPGKDSQQLNMYLKPQKPLPVSEEKVITLAAEQDNNLSQPYQYQPGPQQQVVTQAQKPHQLTPVETSYHQQHQDPVVTHIPVQVEKTSVLPELHTTTVNVQPYQTDTHQQYHPHVLDGFPQSYQSSRSTGTPPLSTAASHRVIMEPMQQQQQQQLQQQPLLVTIQQQTVHSQVPERHDIVDGFSSSSHDIVPTMSSVPASSTAKLASVTRNREPQEHSVTGIGGISKPRSRVTAPSPTVRRRSSSTSTQESTELRSRSTRSSERSIQSEPRIPTEGGDEQFVTKLYSSVNMKAKGNKPENGTDYKLKSTVPCVPVKKDLTVSLSNGGAVTAPKRNLSSRVGAKSPDVSDFYHVVSDECLPETLSNGTAAERLRTPIDYDGYITAPESVTAKTPSDVSRISSNEMNDSYSPQDDTYHDFEVGSVVEVLIRNEPCYGVIRWIGYIDDPHKKVAGIEMEEEINGGCDGNFDGEQHFVCAPGKGFYVFLRQCRKDGRFLDSLQGNLRDGRSVAAFGSIDCPPVTGDVPPLRYCKRMMGLLGKNRGIQGHHNSCYLDATLFSMFTFSTVFDGVLNRPAAPTDIAEYRDVQRVLKEEIVNPLRQNMYVRADRVMKLRMLLENLSSVSGLTCEEKDPEEFLNSLLHQILKAEPFLKLNSGQEAYFYQLFVEKNESLRIPTVQQLFDQSFLTSDIKLKEIPSCLIIQMPRFGKQFKMYNRIFPSPTLDITDVLEDSPRHCDVCGNIAEYECRECFYQFVREFTMKSYCTKCVGRVHSHKQRAGHNPRKISIPEEFTTLLSPTVIPRVHMDLFAVVCIETSHYVAFVKCGNEPDSPWCFFDSMADRKGEQNGYNIPEVVLCPEVSTWLSDDSPPDLLSDLDKQLPERAKRLFGDAYMCMYQSSAVMMYH